MERQIRVVATPHNPIVMNRLVRLLIAQAQIELMNSDKTEVKRRKRSAGEQSS